MRTGTSSCNLSSCLTSLLCPSLSSSHLKSGAGAEAETETETEAEAEAEAEAGGAGAGAAGAGDPSNPPVPDITVLLVCLVQLPVHGQVLLPQGHVCLVKLLDLGVQVVPKAEKG